LNHFIPPSQDKFFLVNDIDLDKSKKVLEFKDDPSENIK